MMKNIYILSGKIHSGKTTKLMLWIKNKKNVVGILQPVVDGKRFFYDISAKQLKQFEIGKEVSKDIIIIGNYKFSLDTFLWANKRLVDLLFTDFLWMIIDEVGKLEMNNEGIFNAVNKIIFKAHEMRNAKFLFVVREELLEKFLEKFSLKKTDIRIFKFK
jgi:nucleoside-triphosphatase THEP1